MTTYNRDGLRVSSHLEDCPEHEDYEGPLWACAAGHGFRISVTVVCPVWVAVEDERRALVKSEWGECGQKLTLIDCTCPSDSEMREAAQLHERGL